MQFAQVQLVLYKSYYISLGFVFYIALLYCLSPFNSCFNFGGHHFCACKSVFIDRIHYVCILSIPSAGGVYVDLELPVGCHQYMFRVDGQWRLDPSNILVSLYCKL